MLKHAKLVNKPVFGKFELIVLAINWPVLLLVSWCNISNLDDQGIINTLIFIYIQRVHIYMVQYHFSIFVIKYVMFVSIQYSFTEKKKKTVD